MDTDSPQGGNDERDTRKPYTRPELQSFGAREQSRDPVLGNTDGEYDYKYPPRYCDEFHTALHDYGAPHHHGPDEYDILVHDHHPVINDDKHGHSIIDFDYDGSCYEFDYGPADHQHDTGSGDGPPSDGERSDSDRSVGAAVADLGGGAGI